MYIIEKTSANPEQLLSKKNTCIYLELQLFDDFRKSNVEQIYKNVTSIRSVDIRCVHMPLIKGEEFNIEYIEDEDCYNELYKTVELAGKLSKFYNHEVKVIFHLGMEYFVLSKIPSLLDKIRSFCSNALMKYPNICICFENVVPCEVKYGGISHRGGFLFDNVLLVKYLRNKLDTDRIGTVLDLCHMKATLNYFRRVFINDLNKYTIDYTVDKFFEENKDYVKLIHLADVKDIGLYSESHGTAFSDDRKYLMAYYIEKYKKYGFNCDITIEVQEKDYMKNENFKDNFDYLKKII